MIFLSLTHILGILFPRDKSIKYIFSHRYHKNITEIKPKMTECSSFIEIRQYDVFI